MLIPTLHYSTAHVDRPEENIKVNIYVDRCTCYCILYSVHTDMYDSTYYIHLEFTLR